MPDGGGCAYTAATPPVRALDRAKKAGASGVHHLHSIVEGSPGCLQRAAGREKGARRIPGPGEGLLRRAYAWAHPRVVTDNGACYRFGDFARITGTRTRHKRPAVTRAITAGLWDLAAVALAGRTTVKVDLVSSSTVDRRRGGHVEPEGRGDLIGAGRRPHRLVHAHGPAPSQSRPNGASPLTIPRGCHRGRDTHKFTHHAAAWT